MGDADALQMRRCAQRMRQCVACPVRVLRMCNAHTVPCTHSAYAEHSPLHHRTLTLPEAAGGGSGVRVLCCQVWKGAVRIGLAEPQP